MTPAVTSLLSGAALALALEVTGAGVGERKRIPRVHEGVVVAAAGAVAFALAPSWEQAMVALALLLFALAEGAALLGERAALALLLAAGTTAVLPPGAPSSTSLLAWIALHAAATAGLGARAGRDAPAEAATKMAVLGALATLLLGAGVLCAATGAVHVGRALEVTGLALALGVAPLQGLRVDTAHGAPVPAIVLSAPLSLLVLGPALGARLAGDGVWREALDIALMLGLFALPLVALAQTSIRRVLAVLLVAQASLPLAASLATSLATSVDAPGAGASPASSLTTAALFTAGLGAAGLAIAVAALPALQGPEVTWEDVSGEGRRHPWRAGLLVLAAAQACGLPPATGFVVRFELAQRLAAQAPWVAGGLLVGAGLAAVPVVRLALFLFARAPRRAPPQPASVGPVVGLAVVVVLGVLVGVFGPR